MQCINTMNMFDNHEKHPIDNWDQISEELYEASRGAYTYNDGIYTPWSQNPTCAIADICVTSPSDSYNQTPSRLESCTKFLPDHIQPSSQQYDQGGASSMDTDDSVDASTRDTNNSDKTSIIGINVSSEAPTIYIDDSDSGDDVSELSTYSEDSEDSETGDVDVYDQDPTQISDQVKGSTLVCVNIIPFAEFGPLKHKRWIIS